MYYTEYYTDPAIRNLVTALNNAGYPTKESCEGHLLITGKVTNAYIRFLPRTLRTSSDREKARSIIRQYTDTTIIWLRSDEVRFRGSLNKKPTASRADAVNLLRDIERGGGGPGRSVEKILSMYDIDDLRNITE